MELLDLFLSNWPDPKTTGFGWGIGPTFVFPTGRVSEAGIMRGRLDPPPLTEAFHTSWWASCFRAQSRLHIRIPRQLLKASWSFNRSSPYTLGHGWYVKSADSTWKVNLRHGTSTTIPISLGLWEGLETGGL
jgi:hypothetical protein